MNQANSGRRDSIPRLWYLTETFYPHFVGGLEIHANLLSEQLASNGQDIFVVTRQIEPSWAKFEMVGNVRVKRIPPRGILKGIGWKALVPILNLILRTFYLLLRNVRCYDIVLVSGWKILSIPAVLVSRACGKKCVIKIDSPMELWEDISTDSLKKMKMGSSSSILKWLRHLRAALVGRADCFVAISNEIRQELIGLGVDAQKIRPIPNGIDTNKFHPVTSAEKVKRRQELYLPTEKVIFVYTGRIAISKGTLLLIRVWQDLVQKYKDIHLLIVGSGKNSFDRCEVELKDFIETNHLGESVSLAGEVENVFQYLQASDVFVFPSEYEGFSLALVEALACALPSVVTRVGAASELIQDRISGVLVNPKDPREMQMALEWILNHRHLWVAMGENGRKEVHEKYSIRVVAEKYLEMFLQLSGTKMEARPTNRQAEVV
jgi:glycosyltransferase involved in cell wall biosynthesis